LFNQFQAWAAEEDAQAQVRPLQPVQGAQAPSVQKAPYQSLDRSKPLGRRTCRHKMPLGLCEASAGTIDLSGTGASPLEQACSSVILE
jgi:hypothetical protein